ncbi:MAG: hypothetical protein J6U20_02590 [Fibrobacter sp.]|nr:hypothetical protein [Fibrobacter sp.]
MSATESNYLTLESNVYQLYEAAGTILLSGYLYVPQGAEVVIDLNGVSIGRQLNGSIKNGTIFVVEGKLTIQDNSEKATGCILGGKESAPLGASAVLVKKGGSLTLAGGTLQGNDEDKSPAALNVYGSFEMRGGTVTGDSYGVRADSGSTVTVSGGAIQGNKTNGLFADKGSNVSISGGEFSGNIYFVNAFEDINISGNPKFIDNSTLVLNDDKKINVVGALHDDAVINIFSANPLTDDQPKKAISGRSQYIVGGLDTIGIIKYNDLNEGETYQLYAYDKTLMIKKEYPAIRFAKKEGKSIVIVDGDYYGKVNSVAAQSVDSAILERKFTVTGDGAYSTIQLPFDVEVDSLIGVKNVYNFAGIEETDGKFKVILKNVKEEPKCGKRACIKAYKSYILEMGSTELKFRGSVQIEKTPQAYYVTDTIGDWVITAPDRYYEWSSDDYAVGAYGFNARTSDEISSVGKFVKLGAGAWMPPFRASIFNLKAMQQPGGITKPVPVLPESLDVVIVSSIGGNEETTTIGRIDTRTGTFSMERDFDIKGRKLNGAPKARGAYYGKKVLKK